MTSVAGPNIAPTVVAGYPHSPDSRCSIVDVRGNADVGRVAAPARARAGVFRIVPVCSWSRRILRRDRAWWWHQTGESRPAVDDVGEGRECAGHNEAVTVAGGGQVGIRS